jgi:hypothetical protein
LPPIGLISADSPLVAICHDSPETLEVVLPIVPCRRNRIQKKCMIGRRLCWQHAI